MRGFSRRDRCRKPRWRSTVGGRGYVEQVQAWREPCEAACQPAAAGARGAAAQADRKRIRELEKALARKERALAETAAWLVLRKKAAAIWGEEAE